MKDEELLSLNQAGFIPGPDENVEAFQARVQRSKRKFEEGSWIPPAHWDFAKENLSRLFDVKPLYICAFYSDKNLTPWQGAAAWIEGTELHSIQLRKSFAKGSFLKLYDRSEILAHEAVHAARSAFPNQRFEEYFAYMTSSKKWRQIMGPILRNPWEVWPFFLTCLLGAIWPISFLFATFWATLGFLRLIKSHYILRKASVQIFQETGDYQKTRSILVRLTDEEIERFTNGETIARYGQGRHDLRWKIILTYCKDGPYGEKNNCSTG